MNYADVSGLSGKELVRKMKELRGQIFEARMKNALGQLTNPMTIREMRRDVARLKTAFLAKVRNPEAPAKKTTRKAKAGAKG